MASARSLRSRNRYLRSRFSRVLAIRSFRRHEHLGKSAEGVGEPVAHDASGCDAHPIRVRKLPSQVTLDRSRRRGDRFQLLDDGADLVELHGPCRPCGVLECLDALAAVVDIQWDGVRLLRPDLYPL